MTKNDIDKPSNNELVSFYLDYISRHSYYKIRNLVLIYMKNNNKIENAKNRDNMKRSLSIRFTRISARAMKLNLVEKDNKVYKILKNIVKKCLLKTLNNQ